MKSTGKKLDDTDKRVLSMISKGYTHKEVSKEIYLSVQAIKQRLSVLRRYYDCKTTAHLIAHIVEECLLKE